MTLKSNLWITLEVDIAQLTNLRNRLFWFGGLNLPSWLFICSHLKPSELQIDPGASSHVQLLKRKKYLLPLSCCYVSYQSSVAVSGVGFSRGLCFTNYSTFSWKTSWFNSELYICTFCCQCMTLMSLWYSLCTCKFFLCRFPFLWCSRIFRVL